MGPILGRSWVASGVSFVGISVWATVIGHRNKRETAICPSGMFCLELFVKSGGPSETLLDLKTWRGVMPLQKRETLKVSVPSCIARLHAVLSSQKVVLPECAVR